jgi:prepilin-type N-terminal cleavage/methylation domain-containing protein
MKMKTSREAGFTLVEIMIVVAIIGLLGAIAIPNFVKARLTSQANACINNLRQIDGAKQQWALEKNLPVSALPIDTDIAPYMGRGSTGVLVNTVGGQTLGLLNCPGNGKYTIGDVSTKPSCNIAGTQPHQLPL